MQTPWFLHHLGLTEAADAADIKRAYAGQLKQIDQSTDIHGFMQLREAYAAATAWCRHAHDDAAGQRAAATAPGTPLSSSSTAPAPTDMAPPDPHAPLNVATRAMQQLEQRLGNREPPGAVLGEQLASLQGEHLQVTAIFEAMLIDGLATMRLPQRMALFGAAQDQLGWNDIVHVQRMGQRGQWIRAVQDEAFAWRRTADATGCHDLLDRLGGAPALDRTDLVPADFTRDATLRWPDMQQLLRRYPNYLALRIERTALAAWQQAYGQLPPRDKAMAESFSNLPSPETYRRATPSRQKTHYGWPVGLVFAALAALNIIGHLIGGQSTTPPPSAYTVASATPRTTAPVPQRIAINAEVCQGLDRRIHAPGWAPPSDPLERRYLGDAVFGCIKTDDWPNLHWDDPALRRLGI